VSRFTVTRLLRRGIEALRRKIEEIEA